MSSLCQGLYPINKKTEVNQQKNIHINESMLEMKDYTTINIPNPNLKFTKFKF